MNLLTALRTATGSTHSAIEQLPVCRAMLNGPLDRDTYTRLLVDLYHIADCAEEALAELPGWPTTPSRAEAAARDLAMFQSWPGERPNWATDWSVLIQNLGSPNSWAGVGYVLEGSRMGSRILAKTVARELNLPVELGTGLDYHLAAGTDPNATWKTVLGALSAIPADDHGAVVRAAVATFELLYHRHELATDSKLTEMEAISI